MISRMNISPFFKDYLFLGILLILVIFASPITQAQQPKLAEKKTSELAGTNLHSLLPKACYLLGNYSQNKTMSGIKKPLESAGTFLFSCDSGLIWYTHTPINETLVYSKQGTQTKIHADAKQEKLNNRLHKHLSTLLNGLIGVDTTYINKYFTAKGDEQNIQLIPKKRRMKKFISSIDLQKKQTSTDITIHHKDDQKTSMSIFATEELAVLDKAQCKMHLTSTQAQAACDILFQK